MKAKTFGLLMFCVAGIYVSYLTQGVVQESMATKRYGKDQVHNPSAKLSLVLISSMCHVAHHDLLLVFAIQLNVSKECPRFSPFSRRNLFFK